MEKELLDKIDAEIEKVYDDRSKHGMSFAEAFVLLRNGKCIRRASWLGYWEPDGENVIMRCKDGSQLSMKDGCSPMLTLENTLAHDWLYVDEAHKAELDKIHSSKILCHGDEKKKI